MKTKDLTIVGLVFMLIIEFGANFYSEHRIFKLQKEVLDTKIEVINYYAETKEYIKVLEDSRESLNNYIDDLEYRIKDIQNKDKLLKDLVKHR